MSKKVFISHSSNDKRFVRTLKEDLNENNIETFVDEDQLELGDSLIEKLNNEITTATHFIIVLSNHSVNSKWVKLELEKALIQKSKNHVLQKIIPVLYRECQIPPNISKLLYADLSKEVVLIEQNKVKFTSEVYPNFVNKLVRTINSKSTATQVVKNAVPTKRKSKK